jgi:hypothetical protein
MKNVQMKQKITISIDWNFPNPKRMGKKGEKPIFDHVIDELRGEIGSFVDVDSIEISHKLIKVKANAKKR